MKMIVAYIKPERLNDVKQALYCPWKKPCASAPARTDRPPWANACKPNLSPARKACPQAFRAFMMYE